MAVLHDGPTLTLTRDDAWFLAGVLACGLSQMRTDGEDLPDDVERLVRQVNSLALREVSGPLDTSQDGYVSIEEAAALLRCSVKTVRRRIRDGKLPAEVDDHGYYLLRVEDL